MMSAPVGTPCSPWEPDPGSGALSQRREPSAGARAAAPRTGPRYCEICPDPATKHELESGEEECGIL